MASGRIVFDTGMSAFSPGERYFVEVAGRDGDITVTITGDKRSWYALQPARIAKVSREVLAAIAEAVGGGEPPWRRGQT